MFERKSAVFFFSFFVGYILLFMKVPHSYAVGCNATCGGSITCDAGLSCDAGTGLCKPPPPSCASAYPQSITTNSTTGTFYSYATGVANADSVYFPTWSTISGQDDLVWYLGTNTGGGTWRGDINLGTHSAGAQAIRTDVYMNNCGYTNVFCGAANFSICPVAIACPGTCHADTQYVSDGACGQTSCPPNAPANVTCESLTCHTNTQNVSDGNCGTHACTSNAPAAVACPTYCGYPGGDVVPNGDCTTTTCPAVPDNSPPSVPSLSSTTANCSGSMAFSWAPVTDNGCYGNVDYQLQIDDSTDPWPVNGWVSAISWPSNSWAKSGANPIVVGLASPVVGRVYKAQIKSSDNGANHINQSLWSAGALWSTGVPYCCASSVADFTTLSPSGGTCYGLPGSATSFPATYSWNAITGASGYNLSISHSTNGNCLTDYPVGNVTSYKLTADQQAACNAKGSGTYTWSIVATYSGGCPPSARSAARSFKFDKSPPIIPMPTIAFSPESVSCPGKYKATLSWNAVNDNVGDCAGIDILPYTSVVSTSNTYSPPATGWDTNWTALRSQTSSLGWVGGTQIYGEVKARDTKGNETVWSEIAGGTGVTIPSPTPFPTMYIYGNYIEDTGTTAPICSGQMTIDPSLLNINLSVSGPGVTPICTPHDTWYECTITVDNINTPCATIDHSVALDGSYGTYEPGRWRQQSTCNGTPVPTITIMITMGPPPPGPSPTPANIFFPYGTSSGGWFKEKNTSFYNRKVRTNTIPNNPLAFDATGDDNINPPNNKYLVIGEAGTILNAGSINLGPNATNITGQGSEVAYSSSNWGISSYTASSLFSPAKFTDYTKSRKQYMTITKNDLSELVTSGMYYLKEDLVIDASNVGIFKDKNIILFSDTASVIIRNNIDNDNSDGFILGTGSLGIVVNTITIDNTLTEVDAILIGNTVNVGTSGVKLKIKGNLVSLDGTFNNNRLQDNAQYPSLFVIFDPKTYLDLLPYLSISMYDWKQVQ